MANTILIGTQWGDEGKGKIIDVLTESADLVVRYQGGNNAGHTVELPSGKYILHLVPSGILRPGCRCVIGNGVVVDPLALVEELNGLSEADVDFSGRLLISDRAHMVLPFHKQLDELREDLKGDGKIGTTKRGIGPAYGDKAARVGLRMGDLLNPSLFRSRLAARLVEINDIFRAHGWPEIDSGKLAEEMLEAGQMLAPMITDTVAVLQEALRKQSGILLEGAQGTLLDIDMGTYPFVTSSNTTSAGACAGAGIPPHKIDDVIGVMKAYTTRVGEGPFPTEDAELSEHFHGMGREFGATTGRPRRCGWLDSVGLKFASQINGLDRLALTNLDGLDGVKTIKIATHYEIDGKKIEHFPADIDVLQKCVPVYEEVPGWDEDTSQCRSWEELPENARAYLNRIEKITGAKVAVVSVGARRDQTMIR
jgi:adenylosuccinate synthase